MQKLNYRLGLCMGLLSLNSFSSCVTTKQGMGRVRDIRERGCTLGSLKRNYNRNPKKFVSGIVVGTTLALGAATMGVYNVLDNRSISNVTDFNGSNAIGSTLTPFNPSKTEVCNRTGSHTTSCMGSTRAYSAYIPSTTPLPTEDLFSAILKGDVELLKYSLKNGAKINERNEYRFTPLYSAAREGNLEIFEILLQVKNIDVNATHQDEYTVLHWAAFRNDTALIELLLPVKELKVNQQDRYGYAPLHTAVNENNVQAVKSLLKHKNIDIQLKNIFGRTALDLAKAKNYVECMEAINEALIQRKIKYSYKK